MDELVQQLQDKYFAEYKSWCVDHPTDMKYELTRWETNILDLPVNEQATYADYVTQKMCEEQPEDVIVHMCRAKFINPQLITRKLNTCAIGGLALYLKTLNEYEGHDDLKSLIQNNFYICIANQKEFTEQPCCIC